MSPRCPLEHGFRTVLSVPRLPFSSSITGALCLWGGLSYVAFVAQSSDARRRTRQMPALNKRDVATECDRSILPCVQLERQEGGCYAAKALP